MHAELRQRVGSGPPLVYVPGIDGSGAYLLRTEERLAARYEVLSVRYRNDTSPDSYEHLAASVAQCLERELEGPALVVAESFGVAVALQLALDHPGRARALMLVNGFARFDRRLHLALTRALAPLTTPWLFALGRPLAARLGLFGRRSDDPALATFLRQAPGVIGPGYRRRLAMIREVDLFPRLPELALPVAIYASDGDRVVPAVRAGRAMAARLPDATLEVLPSAGHIVLPLEREPWPVRVDALAARADALTAPSPRGPSPAAGSASTSG